MPLAFHPYQSPADYSRIAAFLVRHYQPDNRDGNWFQTTWEYMHSHPYLDKSALGEIGIWEAGGEIAAVANYESRLGEAFFQFHPRYRHLRAEMLDYAEQHLARQTGEGKSSLSAYVNDNDAEFSALVRSRGYQRNADEDRPTAQFAIPDLFPAVTLPTGFRLFSLADECDWARVDRVLWRGFNHPGEPPADQVDERKKMADTPNFRFDLKIVTRAPNGDYASFCGMWYQPDNQYAYVEPVATDPAYRRLGLGRAAVLEGIRRCVRLGATTAYVGSDQTFYLSYGFRVIYTSACWQKEFVIDG